MCCGVGEEAVDEGFVVVVSFLLSSLSLPPSCLGCGGGGDEVVVVVAVSGSWFTTDISIVVIGCAMVWLYILGRGKESDRPIILFICLSQLRKTAALHLIYI